MGDAIMAVWGVPFADDDHAVAACHASLDQQDAITEIAAGLREKYNVTIYARMGVNSGEVSAAMAPFESTLHVDLVSRH